MNALRYPTLLATWLLWLGVAPLPAALFVAPADGPVAFRVDRLRLDVDAMMSLSQQLGALAAAQPGESARQRRSAAQALALALALQPTNSDARRILQKFAMGETPAKPEPAQLEWVRAQLWQYFGWLETPAAGKDSQALAACLGDILVAADPQHPRAASLRKSGELGAWTGWVQPVTAFEKIPPVVKPPPSDKPLLPAPVKKPMPGAPIMLATAGVRTPLWIHDKAAKATVLRSVPVRMQAKLKESASKAEPLACFMGFAGESAVLDAATFRRTSETLVAALVKQYGTVPNGVSVGLVCDDNADYLLARNRSAISGAAAVLMNAAITGGEPDATVIGEIQADGSFKMPPRFWEKLLALAGGPGGRLVVPMEAERYLPSILAMEYPDFFFKYEVLCAASLSDLLARSVKEAEPELAQAAAKFAEVRSKLGTQPVSQYIANPHIQRRLADISKGASYHASARLLALQGEGKRPTELPRSILACELRKAIQPMAWIPRYNINGYYDIKIGGPMINTNDLNRTFETCVKEVDRLARYVGMRDRDLHLRVREMVTTIRTLSRASRGRADVISRKIPFGAEFGALVRAHQAVMKELNTTAIDESFF
jgi:hypothetical protein